MSRLFHQDDAISAHQALQIKSIERDKTLDLIGKSIAIAKVKGESRVFMPNTLVSKETKRSLCATFPKVKFSVRIHRDLYILVRWTDGPSEKRAEAAIGAFALEDDCKNAVTYDVPLRTKTFTRDGVAISHMVLFFRRDVSRRRAPRKLRYKTTLFHWSYPHDGVARW